MAFFLWGYRICYISRFWTGGETIFFFAILKELRDDLLYWRFLRKNVTIFFEDYEGVTGHSLIYFFQKNDVKIFYFDDPQGVTRQSLFCRFCGDYEKIFHLVDIEWMTRQSSILAILSLRFISNVFSGNLWNNQKYYFWYHSYFVLTSWRLQLKTYTFFKVQHDVVKIIRCVASSLFHFDSIFLMFWVRYCALFVLLKNSHGLMYNIHSFLRS